MQYRQLGPLRVSRIGLGTMSWPGSNYGEAGHMPSAEDFASTRGMVAAALEAGITLFDTAEGYGMGLAEEFLGQALFDLGCRDKAVILSKVGPLFREEQVGGRTCDLSPAHIFDRCEKSLRRLKTDRIDLYLAHWPDEMTLIEETMEAISTLLAQGKIRAFGVSNFPNDLIERALACGPVVANELPYSLADRTIEADKQPYCAGQGVGILAYTPLGKGILSGKYDIKHLPPADDYRHQRKYFAKENLPAFVEISVELKRLAAELACTPAQLALAWVLSRTAITTALPGAKSRDQVRLNAGAADLVVPTEVLARLDAVSKI